MTKQEAITTLEALTQKMSKAKAYDLDIRNTEMHLDQARATLNFWKRLSAEKLQSVEWELICAGSDLNKAFDRW